jgi:hypothetical protein
LAFNCDMSTCSVSVSRWTRPLAAACVGLVLVVASRGVSAADLTFNINFIAESNPFPPVSGTNFSYADVWSENGYVYVGSDRGYSATSPARGVAVFSINNAGVPTFLPPQSSPPALPPGVVAGATYAPTTYYGSEMEDVEVYDGIGYFSSDVNGANGRTGVDIVDLSIPFDPVMLSRVDTSDCLSGNPGVCAHGKVHTLSIQRFNPNTPSETRFLYTSDNESTILKITDVTNPSAPQLVTSFSLPGVSGSVDSHEVVVRNNRLYVASKNPGSTSTDGWFHIYDVMNPANPVLLKAFLTGASTHTAMPTDDGKTLIVAEERSNGNVKIYDISNINSPNDPDAPILKATLSAASVCHNGTCISAHSPHHVHTHGNLMFMPWYEAGLQVFNISNPASPVLVGAFDTCRQNVDQGACFATGTSTNFNGNWGVDLSMGLKRVLLSDRTRGLIVVDASAVVIPGDYNQDMIVNAADYDVWRAAFGTTRSSVHDAPYADGNYDGVVDGADYVVWRDHFGQVQTGMAVGSSLVPEPASALLLVVGASLMMPRRRVRAA